jgi:protein-S-isoprenylcysteine O-methyltransferase Ste14
MFSDFLVKYRTRLSQLLGIIFIIILIISENELEYSHPLITSAMFILGLIMVTIAATGRIWCAQYIAGYKDTILVTEGPYSICRNPLYFFSLIGGLGAGFCTKSIYLTVLIIVVYLIIYPKSIKSEENKLSNLFGDKYAKYKSNVPSFIPNIFLYHEPSEYTINIKIFKRGLFESMYFIYIVILFIFIDILSTYGLFEYYIHIY